MSEGGLVGVGVLLILAAAALLLWWRPKDRAEAWLLLALAAAYGIRGLAASDVDWVYTLARALGQLAEVFLVWAILAFPSGRLRTGGSRALVGAAAFASTVLWLPTLLFSATVPLAGPLVTCESDCPDNLLLVSERLLIAEMSQVAFRVVGVLVLACVAWSLLRRLAVASPAVRRTLAPLLVVSTCRVVSVAIFVGSGGSWLSGVALTATFWAVPVAMTLGLLLGRLYTARAMLHLVSGLERRPGPEQLRAVMAGAMEDPELEIVYWLPEQRTWLGSGARSSQLPRVPPGRALQVLEGREGPLAALVVDQALLEDPVLLDGVTAAARIALESNRALVELAASEARVADATTQARRTLERDLHDGAQQRLIALRMKVSVLKRLLDQDVRRAAELVDQLGPDLDATLAEVRAVAHGQRPDHLAGGLPYALARLADEVMLPTQVAVEGVGRYPPGVEDAVYYVCAEALQNAAKHAGTDARVDVTLVDDGSCLRLTVSDDGGRVREGPLADGYGLSNMRARFAAHGGSLSVEPGAGMGVTVRGWIPIG